MLHRDDSIFGLATIEGLDHELIKLYFQLYFTLSLDFAMAIQIFPYLC